MNAIKFLAVLFWLEITARIVTGRKPGEQGFLVSLTMLEPQTDLERAGLYEALFPGADRDR